MSAQVDKLTAEQLRDAINELQKKQPYCYDPDKPLDTLKTIGRYIGELQSLVRDLYECGKYECNDTCPHHDTGTKKFCEFGSAGWLNERMAALGLLGGDAE